MQEKYCGGCKQTLPVKSFNKNRGRKDGLQTQCGVCICTQAKKSRTNAIEMILNFALKESCPFIFVQHSTKNMNHTYFNT